MNKNKIVPILTLAVSMLLSACSGGNSSSKDSYNPGDESTSVTPIEEKYKVIVSMCPSGIKYSLDKEEAKEDEEVTFTITEVADGFRVTGVQVNKKNIEGANNVYKFRMPFGGASIAVLYAVDGDVTIQGELGCVLNETSTPGVFKGTAQAVSTATDVGFNLYVGENKQDYYASYDPTHSFGNICWPYGSAYSFTVAAGCTYEFTYDTSKQRPFTIVRTSVDVLPTNADTLYALFDGDAGPGCSQNTCNPMDTKHVTYALTDSTGDEFINLTYEYKRFADKSSLALVTDIANEDSFFTYKKIDEQKKYYEVASNYPKRLVNNDPFLKEYGFDGKFAARYDIRDDIYLREGKWFDEDKYEKPMDYVERDFYQWNAHAGNALEWEFCYAYRVDSTSAVINGASYVDYKVTSTKNGDGSFKVVLDSVVEENREASGADVEEHCGKIYKVDFEFAKNGAITSMNYKFYNYSRDKWDFTKHEPAATVGVARKITYTAEYGDAYTGSANFSTDPYFINKINAVTWNNPAVGTGNCVGYGDYVSIKTTDGSQNQYLKTFDFEPKTALDAWQYDVVSDSKNYLDFTYSTPIAAGVGDTKVKITNHTKNSGVTFESDVKFEYAKSIQDFYLVGTDHASSMTVYAGDTESVHVSATTISGYHSMFAPIVYTVKPYIKVLERDDFGETKEVKKDASDLITISRHDTILTVTPSDSITEEITIYLFLDSPYYGKADRTTTITCYVKVNEKVNLPGTSWQTQEGYFVDKSGNPLKDYIKVDFSNEAVTGKDGYKKGTIYDVQYNTQGALQYTDKFTFIYHVSNGYRITAEVTGMQIESGYTLGSFDSYIWDLMFEIHSGKLGMAMMAHNDSEGYAIFGDWTSTYYEDEDLTEYECKLMEALEKK